jgi:DNA-binding CsgD family transcriptional regulator
MSDVPTIDKMLQDAFTRVEGDDLQVFFAYFEDLKGHVRKFLAGKARQFPGESHIAGSALFSFFCDLAVLQIPLQEVDDDGYPMLWPLMLKYIERHCEKWKKYYRAKKRKATQVPLASGDSLAPGVEIADYRAENDEQAVAEALTALHERLTPRQRRVADLSAQGFTLEQIAAEIGCSESLVSIEKKAIRTLLETV